MKRSNLIVSLAYMLLGVIFLGIALLVGPDLKGLFFGFAGAGIGPGLVGVYRYWRWSAPKNAARYAEMTAAKKIEMHDELKEKLRDRAGRYTYLIGLLLLSGTMVVIEILDSLKIISEGSLIILVLGGLLIFQVVAGTVIFKHLLKKY